MSESPDPLKTAPELAPLADALKTLAPTTTTINRDRLLFEAGRAAATPRLAWLWPSSTALFAGVSLVLAAFLYSPDRRPPTVIERVRVVEVRIPVPAEPPSLSPATVSNEVADSNSGPSPEAVRMLQVRRDVLRWGPDMLPAAKTSPDAQPPSDTARDLDRWLDVPPGTFTAPYHIAPRVVPRLNWR